MLRNLLLRDLSVHRRVLGAAAILPLFLAFTLGLTPSAHNQDVAMIVILVGLVLMALLPIALQAREGMLGTLGDLLALPVPRRDLVRLRFLEAFLATLAYALLHLVSWCLFHRTWPTLVWEVFRTPALFWFTLCFLAYPLPFYLRWRGKGLVLAFGLAGGALYGWGYLALRALRANQLPPGTALIQALGRLHDAWGLTSARLMEYGGPLVLIGLCYAAAVAVANRMEA